jgi:hypothetical protein
MRSRLAFEEMRDRSLPAMTESLSVRQARFDELRSRLIGALTPEAAASNLASIIEADASDAGIAVITVTLRPDTLVRLGFARVSVQLAAEGDISGLVELLYLLERRSLPVAVRELTISQGDPLAGTSKPEALRMDILVETVAQIDAPSLAKRIVR